MLSSHTAAVSQFGLSFLLKGTRATGWSLEPLGHPGIWILKSTASYKWAHFMAYCLSFMSFFRPESLTICLGDITQQQIAVMVQHMRWIWKYLHHHSGSFTVSCTESRGLYFYTWTVVLDLRMGGGTPWSNGKMLEGHKTIYGTEATKKAIFFSDFSPFYFLHTFRTWTHFRPSLIIYVITSILHFIMNETTQPARHNHSSAERSTFMAHCGIASRNWFHFKELQSEKVANYRTSTALHLVDSFIQSALPYWESILR